MASDMEDIRRLAYRALFHTRYQVPRVQWWEGEEAALRVLGSLGLTPVKDPVIRLT